MIKKVILIFCLFFLVGCTNNNKLTLNEIIDNSLDNKNYKINTYNKGYKYYLPSGFSVSKDNGFIQELTSKNNTYYLNLDIVSYYYEKNIDSNHELDDYEYYEFGDEDKTGYLRVTKKNDNFFVELCYNYAIIEVEVEESNLRYAISRGMLILNSIEYNDLVIDKYINDNDLESSETVYTIPEPAKKNTKNILEYIDSDDEDDEDE